MPAKPGVSGTRDLADVAAVLPALGQGLVWNGSGYAPQLVSTPLVPTGIKTAAYTASPGDLVPVDTTAGPVTITLPTAPADRTQVAVKIVKQASAHTVSVVRGGTDVFNLVGGATTLTLTLLAQGAFLQYSSAGGIWYVLADDLALSQLDARYAAAGSVGSGTNVTVTQAAHGFTVGQILRRASGGYVLSKADAAANADVNGMVSSVTDANTFVLALPGSHVTGLTGLVDGGDYYLDPVTAGAMTLTEPVAAGQVSEPVFHADSVTSGLFEPMRGLVVPAAATREMVFKVLDGSTAIGVSDYANAALTIDADLNGWSLSRVAALVTTAPTGSRPAVTLKKNGTSMLSTNATIDVTEKTSDQAATPPVIKSDGTQTVATGDVITPAGVTADSQTADRGFALKAVFTSP